MQRLRFEVDVIDCDWGAGADLDALRRKLSADTARKVKAVCAVHNETATAVTNDIGKIRQVLGESVLSCKELLPLGGIKEEVTFWEGRIQ